MIASIGSWTLTKEKGAGALLSLEVTASETTQKNHLLCQRELNPWEISFLISPGGTQPLPMEWEEKVLC